LTAYGTIKGGSAGFNGEPADPFRKNLLGSDTGRQIKIKTVLK
jgi:hypothetical protein